MMDTTKEKPEPTAAQLAYRERARDRQDAYLKVNALERKKQERWRELIKPAEDALVAAKQAANAQVQAEFDAQLREARMAEAAASKAEAEARAIHESEEAERDFYPVGTRVRRWDTSRWGRGWSRTDDIGEVQIYRRGDPLADNIRGAYNAPSDGQLIIRAVRKDGTLGLKTHRYHPSMGRREWLPADVTVHPEAGVKS